jgi:hypothetical protein
MTTTANPFKKFDDLGIYPELKRFGTGVSINSLYEYDLYIRGLDRSITLRRGAPTMGETREEATEKIIKRVEFVLEFAKQHNYGLILNQDFWKGFAHWDERLNLEKSQEFICGQQLYKEFKERFPHM